MHKSIHWHAFFKVNTEEKARKLLSRFEEITETNATLTSCERYWKDSTLFDVGFSTSINEEDISHTVFLTLVIAQKLAYEWQITGPSNSESGIWEFRGLTTKTKVTGIEWIQFRIETELSFN
ncbi:hypothetical protein [Paenibacillus sp. 2TAB19]|uniref:hypothetical protein n=1 Tax=Paenibacillus sp. 2TAB19 TaxID=3233003 RepID=UPI003F9EAE78